MGQIFFFQFYYLLCIWNETQSNKISKNFLEMEKKKTIFDENCRNFFHFFSVSIWSIYMKTADLSICRMDSALKIFLKSFWNEQLTLHDLMPGTISFATS